MLGYRFAPRFRDLADQRFWRADLPDGVAQAAGYGPLEAVACNKANLKRIASNSRNPPGPLSSSAIRGRRSSANDGELKRSAHHRCSGGQRRPLPECDSHGSCADGA
ncbi:hypothetical protein DEJ50_00325 [Streptomyces venezuelae]|uniref:Tn3 transposase DDE domain-containing protein n=1 Tax=Streptomyces venezuelae TaxID=54571 RepID=A0A5P2CZH7_STRVZ|nr:hypothetical protein DEJ50_00325 [Streptomyces venezuelae]